MSTRTRTELTEALDALYDSTLNGMCRILAFAWVLVIPAVLAAFTGHLLLARWLMAAAIFGWLAQLLIAALVAACAECVRPHPAPRR